MLSLMWSEHCAYKHSKKLLRRLPTEGPAVLMGPGENAGVVDVGGGLGVAFKVESHNHPSAVEPFQGAATGVGGILRDVFAVGARPIAVLDSLRFGEPAESERSRYLLDRAVGGIGHYGNSIGVPTVGRRDLLRVLLRAELPGQRDVPGARARTSGSSARAAAGPGQRARAAGRADRPRRDRRRLGAGLGRARRGRRGQAPVGADRRPVRGEEAARVLPGAAGLRAAGVAAGPRRRRADLVLVGDGRQGRRRARHRLRARAAARGRAWSRSRSWSPSPRSGCCAWSSPTQVDAVIAVCERWETLATPIGTVTDSGRLRVRAGDEVVGRPAGGDPGRRLPAV